jgi:hypothetical protein
MLQFQIRRGGPYGAAAEPGAVPALRGPRGGRRGIASVLAMLYLVIFGAMAVGFYATVNIAAQVAQNERRAASAQLATESGLAFTRHLLSRLDVPQNLSPDGQFNETYLQLAAKLNGSGNLGGGLVAYGPTALAFPDAGLVKLDPAGERGFRVNLSRAGDRLVARVTGRDESGRFARAVEVTYEKKARWTNVFDFGIASRGAVSTAGAATIKGLTDPARGSILSTSSASTAISINGKAVSGTLCTTNKEARVSLGSGVNIGGTTNTTLIYKESVKTGVVEPRFPDVDTTLYAKYATNTYAAGMSALDNCRVPAGVSCNLSGGAVIRGVLYLEKGASLHCSGGVTVQGVIASANDCPLDLDANVIEFAGSVTSLPVKDLPASFGEVRDLAGVFIIAPTYRVRFWGNVGTINGTIICGQFQMGGSAEGTIVGSVVQMQDVPMTISGSADIVIAGTGATTYPPGVTFGAYYAPQPKTYLEVAP